MDRRNFLLTGSALSAALGAGAPGPALATTAAPSLRGPYLDLTTGKGNMIAQARMNANLDETRVKYGSASGVVCAVRPGEALRDLFNFEVVSAARAWRQPEGFYRVLHRETILYTDPASGEVLTEWMNPYFNERVKVVDVCNDPWNETYEEFYPKPPSYGGLNKDTEAPRKPYVLDWRLTPDGNVVAQTHINLYYPSALQPDKWPRESAGKFNQVTEIFSFIVPLKDMQNEKKTSLEYSGGWTRITPWLPWMLMGQAPGHILYDSTVAAFDHLDGFKPKVLAYMQKTHPEMLEPPPKESWSKPNLSSLEVYARTQTPAPALKPVPPS
jgi:hypothetical protein